MRGARPDAVPMCGVGRSAEATDAHDALFSCLASCEDDLRVARVFEAAVATEAPLDSPRGREIWRATMQPLAPVVVSGLGLLGCLHGGFERADHLVA